MYCDEIHSLSMTLFDKCITPAKRSSYTVQFFLVAATPTEMSQYRMTY